MSKPCAVVIGMGPGLGQALVKKFASEGHAVAFIGRREAEIRRHEAKLRTEGLDVTGFPGDAGSQESMEKVFSQIHATYGSPEVLIYNAALIEPSRFVTPSGKSEVKYGTADGWNSLGEPVSVDYLKHAFSVNVAGALDAAKKVVPAMLECGRGTILLTGGVLAFEPWIEWGVTSLSKAALRSLGRSLYKELNDKGIHVCTIAIHGTMQAGTPYDHDLVAAAYWALHQQPAKKWEAEYHFRADEADGKRALVTGGASGIGETTAKLLADLGARVVLADINADGLNDAMQRTGAVGVTSGDVATEHDAEHMVDDAARILGGLDLLFNSAGIGDDLVPVHQQPVDRWQRVLDVNLKGTYLMCRNAGRVMVPQKRGAIVNVASIVGLGAFPGRSAYGTAKAGIMHLTATLGCEWGADGVRVNAIAPAYTKTPMVRDLLDRKIFDPTKIERRTPLGRMGLPEEMAKATAFLLSDWASYITGVTLPVDGGWSAFGGAGDVARNFEPQGK